MGRLLNAVYSPTVVTWAGLILTFGGVFIYPFFPANIDWHWRLVGSIVTILIGLLVISSSAAYRFEKRVASLETEVADLERAASQSKQLRVKGQVRKEGSKDPRDYIVLFENPGFVREGAIVSLTSRYSGADQHIGFLRVSRAQTSEDLQAIAYPPGSTIDDLGGLIKADPPFMLYVSPIVHSSDIEAESAFANGSTLNELVSFLERAQLRSLE